MEQETYTYSHDEPLRLRRYLLPLIGLLLVGYFLYHGVESPQGLRTWLANEEQLEQRHAHLERLQEKRKRLDQSVTLMRPSSIHPDLLDEHARRSLGYVNPDEVVIYTE